MFSGEVYGEVYGELSDEVSDEVTDEVSGEISGEKFRVRNTWLKLRAEKERNDCKHPPMPSTRNSVARMSMDSKSLAICTSTQGPVYHPSSTATWSVGGVQSDHHHVLHVHNMEASK